MQAIVYYTSFAAEGLVPKSALEKDSGQIESGFFNGQYAVIFTGPWILKQMATPKSKGGQLETVTAANFAIAPTTMEVPPCTPTVASLKIYIPNTLSSPEPGIIPKTFTGEVALSLFSFGPPVLPPGR